MLLLISVILTLGVSWAHAEVKPCDFPEIKHGRLSNAEREKPNFPVAVGKQYYYSCNDNFVASSDQSWDLITCTPEGWSPAVPCRRKCVFSYLGNGVSPYYERKYIQGESARVDCHPGYSLPTQQTSMTCTENGWSPPPTCIRDKSKGKCGPPPPIPNGDTTTFLVGEYAPGASVEYQCQSLYVIQGNPQIICTNGEWSDPPKCLESRGKCGPPPPIPNGDTTTFLLAEYAPGASVEYQCQSLYVIQGNPQITCTNGEWSEPPKCLDACVISKEIMEKHNIQPKWTFKEKLYTRTDDIVEFMCKAGHREQSPRSAFRARCQAGKLEYPTCVRRFI